MNKILAIEASGLVASCAIATEEKIIGEFSLNLKLTHSQTLLPMVDEVVKRTGTDLNEIDAIAVSGGPGSFTGLRIGSATAKGLGLALNKPIVAVPTTQTIAANIFGFEGVIVPLMDARRSQVYTGIYRNNAEGFTVVRDQMAVSIDEIIDTVNEIGEPVIFLGDGVPVFREMICEKIKVKAQFAPANNSVQRAGSLAVRALDMFQRGLFVPAADHVPDYLRLSQAERERNEK
ncbi:MAG: tRNA (adenosine(37)-N6)-threonylcarbamoyltransferase complex dimerization subunit type 1 TsaB [Lachnospiraceae bacterium]|nr:tRNA (adenosine(37)-N6)-threonylcarbamoyltransferase complex dimerization subunit type 1 TsaB [Lachnospiraceae bacterium]